MVPLHNGIANVVEYLPGGVSRLHIFDCAKLGPPEVESYSYVVSATGRSIHVSDGSGYSFAMDVIAFDERGTRLDVVIGGQGSFTYQKLENVAPLCELYRSPDLP